MYAPAAARNVEPLVKVLRAYAPNGGTALELASGTGEHAVAFASALPGLSWQPTEPDPARRASIDAWAAFEDLAQIRPAQALDACHPGWGHAWSGQSLVFLSNLLHLISTEEARTLIEEAAIALGPSGRLIIYGPFLRNGRTTSDGDARFHAALTQEDPEIGYKDCDDVLAWAGAAGLQQVATVEMPANNLCLILERPAENPS